MIRKVAIFSLMTIFFSSCKDERIYVPKPKMYPRIVFPEKGYEPFDLDVCNFSFEKPTYADIVTGIDFFGEKSKDPCWFDLEVPELNTSIHFSYNKIEGENSLQKLVTDAFRLAEKHNTKAEYRDEVIVENPQGVNGLIFNIEGPVASPINFFLTDTTEHFVRASLYFNTTVNPDSVAPVLEFIKPDIDRIINTFEWLDR